MRAALRMASADGPPILCFGGKSARAETLVLTDRAFNSRR